MSIVSAVQVHLFTRTNETRPEIQFPLPLSSETEELELKFRTRQTTAPLISVFSSPIPGRPQQYFGLVLLEGRLHYVVNYASPTLGLAEYRLVGSNEDKPLNDYVWHSVRVRRTERLVTTYLDGVWGRMSMRIFS